MANLSTISTLSSKEAIDLEQEYGAHNYKPLPVVIDRGEGVFVYDLEGKRYFDFLSAYSALNQGHCHPRLVKVVQEQAAKLTLTSRAFYSSQLGIAEKHLAQLFKYDKVLLMNSGAEAVETAMKLARKWGYIKKGIKSDEALIVVAQNNFHGRTLAIISASTDISSRRDFGPYLDGFYVVPYDDLGSLETALSNPRVCAFLFEPLQGEAGVMTASSGYLKGVRELCDKHNVLMVDDEIQAGLARTGKLLTAHHEDVRPDVVILGKALSGGMMPVSCVLADDEVMLTIQPGEHGSTFGGNPLAARVAVEATQILLDEKLAENSEKMGKLFRSRMEAIDNGLVTKVRGLGLLNAIVINERPGLTAYDLCLQLKEDGLLAKQTHGNIIRFAPPLIINEEQMNECCDIIDRVLERNA